MIFPSGFAALSFKSRSAFFPSLSVYALGPVNTLLNRSDRQDNPVRNSGPFSLPPEFAIQRVFMSSIKFVKLKREFQIAGSSAHA